MSRCKSPISNIRHERGSSADTGLIRIGIDNLSSNGGSADDPNTTEDERVSRKIFSIESSIHRIMEIGKNRISVNFKIDFINLHNA